MRRGDVKSSDFVVFRVEKKRRQLLSNMQFECCMILQGTLGGIVDIFASRGESTVWVPHLENPFKTQLACFGFVLKSNSISSVPHLIRARGHWLCSGNKVPDVSPN